jgi:hypothetical protein
MDNFRKIGVSVTVLLLLATAFAADFSVSGRVIDPQGNPVAGATVQLVQKQFATTQEAKTNDEGRFEFQARLSGEYLVSVVADGFQPVTETLRLAPGMPSFDVQLGKVSARNESVTVTANVDEISIALPDPGQRIVVRQEMLDANPGRPGAPVSIPGLPIQTASGGIKAPQYFVPGVAGDHGEPIAQYISVGSYLVPNNLSANAHGNGYADPNIFVPQVVSSVEVDGGAFNVLEGNHALNLAAAYGLRSKIDPFLTLTGDYRDIDVVGGFSPAGPTVRSWVLLEAAYGNGLLDRLEHRQQYKLNRFRVYDFGNHELTLFGVGYYGFSYVSGLTPLGVAGLHDTIDPRQKDQTHTAELSANDLWKLTSAQQLQFSGFFRTYNLALFSNFGDGLIRQSEFRTVTGGSSRYINHFNDYISLLAGVDYTRDAPRRLDLDHYDSTNPAYYGPFQKVTANNVTIGDVAPYVALNGAITKRIRYYLGFRRDEIGVDNVDLLNPTNSFNHLVGVNSPKATVSYGPRDGSWLPTAALSFGEAFFTNDPRIGTGTVHGTPVERSHSYQLVVDKSVVGTDFRLTLGHVTTDATLAKIDPDTGLQENEGPGRLRFLTAMARHRFTFGLLQASLSKADARDVLTGQPTPEAPRTIVDVLGTVDRLPFRLQAKSEFEYVGQKPLGDGFVSVPVKEFRAAVVRSLLNRRMDVGVNLLIARGYTGQTTELLALPDETAPFERVVGVRLHSYVGASVSYHF